MEIKSASLFGPGNPKLRKWLNYCYAYTTDAQAEWHMHSFFKNKILAVDLDGVLQDEKTGNPMIIPSFNVEAVITARLESERETVVTWLKEHGVNYNRLLMWTGNKQERSLHNIARYKSKEALRVGADWFWESEPDLAKEISSMLKKPVYCPSNRLIYSPKSSWILSLRDKVNN